MRIVKKFNYVRHQAKIEAIERNAAVGGTLRGSDALFLCRQIRKLTALIEEIILEKESPNAR